MTNPTPPQQTRKVRMIARIVIAVVVVGVGVGAWIASQNDADTAKVGDCMHQGSQDTSDPDLEVVDCTSSDAQYKVLAKVSGYYTTEDDATEKCRAAGASDATRFYTQTGDGKDFLLCLKDL
jgi:hypothetical protein